MDYRTSVDAVVTKEHLIFAAFGIPAFSGRQLKLNGVKPGRREMTEHTEITEETEYFRLCSGSASVWFRYFRLLRSSLFLHFPTPFHYSSSLDECQISGALI
jgi:hypothetical protein